MKHVLFLPAGTISLKGQLDQQTQGAVKAVVSHYHTLVAKGEGVVIVFTAGSFFEKIYEDGERYRCRTSTARLLKEMTVGLGVPRRDVVAIEDKRELDLDQEIEALFQWIKNHAADRVCVFERSWRMPETKSLFKVHRHGLDPLGGPQFFFTLTVGPGASIQAVFSRIEMPLRMMKYAFRRHLAL